MRGRFSDLWILKFQVTYTGWKLYLSFITYLVVLAAAIWLSNFIEKKAPYTSTN
ncbi:hypothetical protein KIS1582_3542 [Cytobacillus firmus]|uniref:Uncharacterized protein n=1 Tax=Cytobacillus firmus TaxID=1399 RepID=A0A800MUI6_CYTFI|nr:hypothetical protein KIS1582_3542 [Cytobacillus firmus]